MATRRAKVGNSGRPRGLPDTLRETIPDSYIIGRRESKNGELAIELVKKQLELPFDQHQRYRIIADVLERLREDSLPLRVLDVGGGEGIILNFLPDDQVTILDQTDDVEVPGFVQGDATALPFEDGAYDYVVSVDVYEHIEPESREKYLFELRRVSRKGVLLAAPFDSGEVRGAEQVANEFHRAVHLTENVWLKEHDENGLPQLDDARSYFENSDDTVFVLPNGYIPHWLAMICLTFYAPKLKGELSGIYDRINTYYNEFMYRHDNAEPCYRYLVVSTREPVGADLKDLVAPDPGTERASESGRLFGTFAAMLPVAAEVTRVSALLARSERRLAQSERRLARSEGDLARKETQVEDLARRLAERIGAENSPQIQAERRIAKLQQDYNSLQQQLTRLTSSRSWRLLTALHRFVLRVGRTDKPD